MSLRKIGSIAEREPCESSHRQKFPRFRPYTAASVWWDGLMKDGAPHSISVTFAYDRALWRRGMTGWWQSVVPPEPFLKRVIFWAVIWFGVGIIALGLAVAGLTMLFAVAGLVGAGIMVASFAYLQRTRMSRFWDEIGRHWDRAGKTRVTADVSGLAIEDDVATRKLSWAAVDAVKAVRGGTVIRSGISMMVVPDEALPEGMAPKAFRAQLNVWRNA